MVSHDGFEPSTLTLKVWCSTDWANGSHQKQNAYQKKEKTILHCFFVLFDQACDWTNDYSLKVLNVSIFSSHFFWFLHSQFILMKQIDNLSILWKKAIAQLRQKLFSIATQVSKQYLAWNLFRKMTFSSFTHLMNHFLCL